MIRAEIPAKLRFLYEKHRYKVIHGGRGKGASWGMADALLIQGTQRPLRWLCTRETQESIEESVHALLSARISHLGLSSYYEIQQKKIISRTFTAESANDPLQGRCGFSFAGLRHNTTGIKSYESYDGAWVEEAEAVSKDSWQILIPTMRKDGSEIWVSFNPRLDTDETYRRFVLNPPRDAVVLRMSWRDNPFFPEVLRREMEELRETDPDACDHIYEGHPRSAVVGAIYERELKRAEVENRMTRVPYDQSKPVDVSFDLGYGDMVSMWFHQAIAFEYRIIDYYQNSRQAIDHYLQVMQGRGYTYGTIVLPWDGGTPSLQNGRSIKDLIKAKGYRVRVLDQSKVADGINAVRTIFGQCYFDGEKCLDGIQGLRRYQWGKESANGVARREPLHDAASHPADALRTMAVWIKAPKKEENREQSHRSQPASAWS